MQIDQSVPQVYTEDEVRDAVAFRRVCTESALLRFLQLPGGVDISLYTTLRPDEMYDVLPRAARGALQCQRDGTQVLPLSFLSAMPSVYPDTRGERPRWVALSPVVRCFDGYDDTEHVMVRSADDPPYPEKLTTTFDLPPLGQRS